MIGQFLNNSPYALKVRAMSDDEMRHTVEAVMLELAYRETLDDMGRAFLLMEWDVLAAEFWKRERMRELRIET